MKRAWLPTNVPCGARWSRLAALVSGTLLGALVPGCYLWHDASAWGARVDAAPSRVDAAVPVGHRDAPAPRPDGSPPDDEPDVLPDERPSDDPSADDWIDPPPSSGDPCCDVGELVPLDPVGVGGITRAVVTWEGAEWGLAYRWRMEPTSFVRLDRTAHPTVDARVLAEVAQRPIDMAWGNHRFALLTMSEVFDEPLGAIVHILDRDGAVLEQWTVAGPPADGVAIARYPAVHGWALALDTGAPRGDRTFTHVRVLGDAGSTVADVALAALPVTSSDTPGPFLSALVSVRSRLVTVRATADGAYVDTLVGPELLSAWPSAQIFVGEPLSISAARLRDHVVVVGAERDDAGTGIRALGLDPFTGGIGDVHVMARDAGTLTTPRIAGDDKGGTALMCWEESTAGGRLSVWVALVDEDGAPIGTPMRVTDATRIEGPCSVGSSGLDEFVVLIHDIGAPEHTLYGARIAVRR